MAVVKQEKEIDGKNILVIKQGLRKRIKAKAVVASIIAPTLSRAVVPILKEGNAEGEAFDLKNINLATIDIEAVIVPAIAGLSESLTEDKLLTLIDTLMQGVFVNDVDVSDNEKFDFVFDDCMSTMYKVCWFALKVNFSDLMSDLSTLIGSPNKEKVAEEQKSSGN